MEFRYQNRIDRKTIMLSGQTTCTRSMNRWSLLRVLRCHRNYLIAFLIDLLCFSFHLIYNLTHCIQVRRFTWPDHYVWGMFARRMLARLTGAADQQTYPCESAECFGAAQQKLNTIPRE